MLSPGQLTLQSYKGYPSNVSLLFTNTKNSNFKLQTQKIYVHAYENNLVNGHYINNIILPNGDKVENLFDINKIKNIVHYEALLRLNPLNQDIGL